MAATAGRVAGLSVDRAGEPLVDQPVPAGTVQRAAGRTLARAGGSPLGEEIAERNPRPVAPPTSVRHLMLYDSSTDPVLYAGRATMRQAVLSLVPVRGAPQVGPLRTAVADATGVFWGLVAPNGLALALRARDFHSVEEARADGDEMVMRADEMTVHRVVRPGSGRYSLWLSLDGLVVLVGGRVWGSSDTDAERVVVRALSGGGPWWPQE